MTTMDRSAKNPADALLTLLPMPTLFCLFVLLNTVDNNSPYK